MLGMLVRIALQMVPRTGLEPACLAALPPQGSASAISPPGHKRVNLIIGVQKFVGKKKIGRFLASL